MRSWTEHDPTLDTDAMEIVLRMARLLARAADSVEAVHRAAGLESGEFDVLASILRAGPIAPKQLAEELLLSKAGISGRLRRLSLRGFIEESPRPDDGRGKLIHLTAAGREVVERTVVCHAAAESEALGPLAPRQARALLTLLRLADAREE